MDRRVRTPRQVYGDAFWGTGQALRDPMSRGWAVDAPIATHPSSMHGSEPKAVEVRKRCYAWRAAGSLSSFRPTAKAAKELSFQLVGFRFRCCSRRQAAVAVQPKQPRCFRL